MCLPFLPVTLDYIDKFSWNFEQYATWLYQICKEM
jgi:hypothetical protein